MVCAGCKYSRRKCSPDCILSPYFPGNDPQKFACVHKVYGANNFIKMIQKVPLNQRAIAAETLYQAANSRLRDPVHGCVGEITSLSKQIDDAQSELAKVQAQIAILSGLDTQNIGKNVPSYGIPGLVEVPIAEGVYSNKIDDAQSELAKVQAQITDLSGLNMQNTGKNEPSYGIPGLMEVPGAEGSKRRRNYEGVQQTPAGNWTAQVYLGSFKSAEEAAMAYDIAELKLHGHGARLNFPYYEAVHFSRDDSAQLISGGGNGPSKRRCDSQSTPGSVLTPQSKKDGFHQTSSQNYIPSSVWSDLSKLDSCLEHDTDSSMVSLLLAAALDIPNQQTLGDMTPPKIELPYVSASQSTLKHMCSEDMILPWLHQETKNFIQATEENAKDTRMEQLCLRKGSPYQTRTLQDGRSETVHHDESDLIVKVSFKGDIVKFELSLSSTKLELEEKVAVRLNLSVGSFDVKYQDMEKEWILVACDEDLRTCMRASISFGDAAIRMMVVCR